jgi:uridine kinase
VWTAPARRPSRTSWRRPSPARRSGSASTTSTTCALRYPRGRDSAAGFWLDAFNYPRLIADVFDPLRTSGRYRPKAHDLAADTELAPSWLAAPPAVVVVIDGLFLLRAELAGRFDLVIFLDVPFPVAARRLAQRDGARPIERYVGASQRYFTECDPQRRADVLIDNSELSSPRLLRSAIGRCSVGNATTS